mmetsp:Transcript_50507/g.109801  ORF Transcript_50507/g.109801 Transcript_50507/m.109801 type:complete len:218 (-) Transcript_50507:1461-2114(-)
MSSHVSTLSHEKRRRRYPRPTMSNNGDSSSSGDVASSSLSGYTTCSRRLPSGMYGRCGKNITPPRPSSAGRCTTPEDGGQMPPNTRSRELFPQPLGPTMTRCSPCLMETESLETMGRPCGVCTRTSSKAMSVSESTTRPPLKRDARPLLSVSSPRPESMTHTRWATAARLPATRKLVWKKAAMVSMPLEAVWTSSRVSYEYWTWPCSLSAKMKTSTR